MNGLVFQSREETLAWYLGVRTGLFIHWGIYSIAGRHEWVQHRESIPPDDYRERYFTTFDPDLFDPKDWARQARRAGMRYVVLTAKHHDGFCLWDSRFTDYKATNTPCGRDLVREICDAFRSEGLGIGLYYSLLDWSHPHFVADPHYGPYHLKKPEELEKINLFWGQVLHRNIFGILLR